MSPEKKIFIGALVVAILYTVYFIYSKLPKKLKTAGFVKRWREIQTMCKDETKWSRAIVEADELLDKALKRKRIKGSSMGERLVSAQKLFGNNDLVWFGHKLRKKIETTPDTKISKDDAKNALLGIGQALKDLGALK